MKRIWAFTYTKPAIAGFEYAVIGVFLLITILSTVYMTGHNVGSMFTGANTGIYGEGAAEIQTANSDVQHYFGASAHQIVWGEQLSAGRITSAQVIRTAQGEAAPQIMNVAWDGDYQSLFPNQPTDMSLFIDTFHEMGWDYAAAQR